MKQRKKMKFNKLCAMLLSVIMCFSLLPTLALADGESAETPVFDTNLSTGPVEYNVGDDADALTVTASVYGDGTLTYQWYSNTESSTENADIIENETDASYTPSTDIAGTTYYYVDVTNTVYGKTPATATSNIACVVVKEEELADSVTAYFFVENTTLRVQGKSNFRAEVDSILPMREVTVTLGDIETINSALETSLGLAENTLSDTNYKAIHFLIKAMTDLGDTNPYSHVTLVQETESGSYVFGDTLTVTSNSSEDYYIRSLTLGGSTVTGLNQEITTYKSASSQSNNKWYSVTYPMQCMVITDGNTTSKDGTLLETPVNNGDILGLTREIVAFTTPSSDNASPFYKMSSPSVSSSVDDAPSLTFQLQSVLDGTAGDVTLEEGETQETKLYKFNEASQMYSEIENYDGPGLYVVRICSSGYYNSDIDQGDSTKAYLSSAYCIVTLTGASSVDKSALQSAIAAVPTEGYYMTGDRWNGSETSENGFWADMQAALTAANMINDNTAATQEEVDTAADDLQTAIDNLIPVTNVNATLLYEAVQIAGTKVADEYTTASWSAMQDEVDAANEMLESLYDDGSPTELNIAGYQTEVDAQTAALTSAIEGLDTRVASEFGYTFNDAVYKYDSLKALYNTLFAGLNEDDYTPESWGAFTSARSEAAAYFASYPDRPTEETYGHIAYDALKSAYAGFVSAAYGLISIDESISVTLTVVDNLAARKDSVDFITGAGIYSLTLNDGYTVADALTQAGIATDIRDLSGDVAYNQAYTIFVNGVFVCGPTANMGANGVGNMLSGLGVSGIHLQNGDAVTVAYLDTPYFLNASSAPTDYFFNEVAKYLRISYLSGNDTVEAGEETTYTATSCASYYAQYSGRMSTLSGATVFVKPPSGSTFENTGVKTGSDGSFSYTFYEEGTYQISIYPLDDNNYNAGIIPGLTAGATMSINVTEPSDPEAVLSALKAELDAVYSAYDENYFTADDWSSIQNHYQTGIDGIQNASTIGEASAAQKTAIAAIKEIQEATTLETNEKLAAFRGFLNRLPGDMTLLGANAQELVNALIESYNGMSDYQQGMVTGMELAKYSDIVDANAAGLPTLAPYQLEINIEADTDDAEAIIEDMIAYLQNNATYSEFEYRERLNQFASYPRDLNGDIYDYSNLGVTTAFPDSEIALGFDAGYYAYFLVRDADSSPAGEKVFSPEGENWSISDEDFELDTEYEHPFTDENGHTGVSYYYEVLNNFTVYINGEAYEIKSIQYDGIESSSVSFNYKNLSDSTDYKGKESNHGRVLFMDAELRFIMPYNNVGVTIIWGPVSGSYADQAVTALTEAFESYDRKDYTIENWAVLLAAYNNGLAAIAAAGDDAAIETAKADALAAMEAVEKKVPEDIQEVGNSVFDAGNQVGTVDLYIENYTFPGGDFTGKIISKPGYALGENDTMMTVVLRALADEGYSWTGTGGSANAGAYDIAYLASITKGEKELGEFSGEAGSGWMGTLNDWFTNEGFQEFSVANGKLADGDEIRIQYTQNLGEDLGGTWGNDDTSLKALRVNTGTLIPVFSSDKNEYVLVISGDSARVKVTPEAANKNYLVKTFLNKKVTTNAEGNSFYKRTEYIPVVPGDIIYIGVGEYAWPSMNNQETEAIDYTGTWYELHVINTNKGASYVNEVISDLPAAKGITMGNYSDYRDAIEYARAIYNVLNETEQAKVNLTKLTAAEDKFAFYEEIQNVKDLLSVIPKASKVTLADKNAVLAADAAYKALFDEQKLYITVGNVENYNAAIAKLKELGAFDRDNYTPSTIIGSEEVPVETVSASIKLETAVTNGKATASVTREQIDEVLDAAEKNDMTDITIKAETDEDITGVSISLPRKSVSEIRQSGLTMTVETPKGNLSFDDKSLEAIADASTDRTVTIEINTVDISSMPEEMQKELKGAVIFELNVIVGDKKVTKLGGTVTGALPYTLKDGERADNVVVVHVSDDGTITELNTVYDEKRGMAVFTTDHFSCYAVLARALQGYVDVSEDAWYYDEVMYVTENGLMNGTSETEFSPEGNMTRAMLVTVLYRLDGEPEVTGTNSFTDVKDDVWYTDAVIWASENSIVGGYSEGLFGTNDNVTREQIALILYRYAGYKGYDVTSSAELTVYADSGNISPWATAAISWATAEGLITGLTETTLVPSGSATRAQVAAILMRFVEKVNLEQC